MEGPVRCVRALIQVAHAHFKGPRRAVGRVEGAGRRGASQAQRPFSSSKLMKQQYSGRHFEATAAMSCIQASVRRFASHLTSSSLWRLVELLLAARKFSDAPAIVLAGSQATKPYNTLEVVIVQQLHYPQQIQESTDLARDS